MVVFALISVPISVCLAYVPYQIKEIVFRRKKLYDNTNSRNNPTIDPETDELVRNLDGCHFNQLESLGPYAGGIAAATACGVGARTLTAISATYVGARTAYIFAYLNNTKMRGYHRTLAWSVAMGAIFWAWIAAAIKKDAEDDEE